jgi:post-segregation antitoxin (ccd killing protein)
MSKRQTVTLELDLETLAAAQAKGLDLSTVLVEALHRQLPELHAEERAEKSRLWRERNHEAIESMNRLTDEDGFVFSDGARSF